MAGRKDSSAPRLMFHAQRDLAARETQGLPAGALAALLRLRDRPEVSFGQRDCRALCETSVNQYSGGKPLSRVGRHFTVVYF